MFVRLVEFTPTSDTTAQFVQVFEQTVLRMVRKQAGCIGAFMELRGQVVMGVSVWKSGADAERYSRECYPEIETMLRPFLKCDPELHTREEREKAGAVGTHVRRATVVKSPSHTLGLRLPRRRCKIS
jgi:quinol monooxygenase YgiN